MDDTHSLSRRKFLQASALAAGGTMLAACGAGQATPTAGTGRGDTTDPNAVPTKAPAAPVATEVSAAGDPTAEATIAGADVGEATPITFAGEYKQAPTLDQVQGLPPVAERLPKNPYVVPHKWLTIGKYGGHIQTSCSSEWGTAHFIQESMYGHSPLRWLNDGLAIGPGLAESWTSNDDASEWTFNFREGLKWSDGKPFTTADIMFWWEDMVLDEAHPAGPPDEARSGKGTLMKMRAVDDVTIQMSFDAPTPLTADRLAMWVKRGIGPDWMQPRHYMEQFHPKYNKKIDPKSEWAETFDEKKDFAINPECPVMTGWKLKSYQEGVNSVWERNPYYWCVDKEGNQLPYVDGITMTNVQNPQVFRLRILEGKVDYIHGGFSPLFLNDVAALRQAQPRSKLDVLLWDAGDGSGSLVFFNQDYAEPKMRQLIRNAKFRQALSHAYNRERVRKTVYFNTGELTTGTLSPKAIEYRINEEGKQVYQAWRDSYIKYDPELAKKILDEIGVVDKNGDGVREMPDGSKLRVTLDFHSDSPDEHVRKNELLTEDWRAVGIDTHMNPVPPDGYEDRWAVGKIMTNTNWETGDGPNHLVYPQWLVPMERSRWAPLQGEFYNVRGTPKEKQELNKDPYKRTPPRMAPEPGGPVDRLWKLYDQSKVEPDAMKRHRLVWDMIKIHIEDGPYLMGVCANTPYLVLVRDGLMNVPTKEELPLGGFAAPWIHPTPAVYDPEAYYWQDPAAHS
ncbi:MAG: ABC transporter substrate-binding protein [Chloroflexota bacterium]|nr:ABC transporter substrate-binding protein [Chloroflexota bacterium]